MIRFLMLGLVAVFIVTGCGYKGPLVMPTAESAADKESSEKTTKNKPPK